MKVHSPPWFIFQYLFFELLTQIDYNNITVVYYLHGQTRRSTVWANGTQNSGLVNFVPESRLQFVQISSIYRKTTAKAWTRYQRWLWRNGTRISIWKIPSGKTGLPFQMFCCSREFSAGTTKKVVFHLLSNRIFLKILVNQQTTYITRGGFPNVWKRLDGFWGLSKRLQGLHRPRLSQQTQDKNRHAEYARHEIQLSQKLGMPGMPAIKTKLVPRLSQRRIIGA